MRILFLAKRQYTGKDLLADRYGRLYEIPTGLAAMGHDVLVLASSYRRRGAMEAREAGVVWRSFDAVPSVWRAPILWQSVAQEFRPDVIVASSDAMHVVAGAWLARRCRTPLVLDFYDDYESFALTALPMLRRLMRLAVADASAVVSVSHTLVETMKQRGKVPRLIGVVPNGVPRGFVLGLTKLEARQALGLPLSDPLIGTAGHLSVQKGMIDLISAFSALRRRFPGVRLVIAGPKEEAIRLLLGDGTIDLGQLSHHETAMVFRALDVGIVCTGSGPFAEACYPMKLAEMIACGLPLVATNSGEVANLLASRPDALYPHGDAYTLSNRIADLLESPRPINQALVDDWSALSQRFAAVLEEAQRTWAS